MEKFNKLSYIATTASLNLSIRHRIEKFLVCSSKTKRQSKFEKIFLKYFSNFHLSRAELYVIIVFLFEKIQQQTTQKEIKVIKKKLELLLQNFSFKDLSRINSEINCEEIRIYEYLELIKANMNFEIVESISLSNIQFSLKGQLRISAIKILISNAFEETIFPELKQILKIIDVEELYAKFEMLQYSKQGLNVADCDVESIILLMKEVENILKLLGKNNKKYITDHVYDELMSKFKIMNKHQKLYTDISYLNDIFILIYMYIDEIYVAIKK